MTKTTLTAAAVAPVLPPSTVSADDGVGDLVTVIQWDHQGCVVLDGINLGYGIVEIIDRLRGGHGDGQRTIAAQLTGANPLSPEGALSCGYPGASPLELTPIN